LDVEAAGVAGAEESGAPYASAEGTKNGPDGLVGAILQRDPELGKLLEAASVDLDGEIVRITANDARRECRLSSRRAELEKLCGDFFRRKIRIEVGVGSGTQEVKRGPEPLVQEALEVFGGKVLEESRRSSNV
jgi:hypothetical protein